jgi:hypothetical protein
MHEAMAMFVTRDSVSLGNESWKSGLSGASRKKNGPSGANRDVEEEFGIRVL